MVIGVDPHKASHTAVAIDGTKDEVSSIKVRATRRRVEHLVGIALAGAEPEQPHVHVEHVSDLDEQQWALRGRCGTRTHDLSRVRVRSTPTMTSPAG